MPAVRQDSYRIVSERLMPGLIARSGYNKGRQEVLRESVLVRTGGLDAASEAEATRPEFAEPVWAEHRATPDVMGFGP